MLAAPMKLAIEEKLPKAIISRRAESRNCHYLNAVCDFEKSTEYLAQILHSHIAKSSKNRCSKGGAVTPNKHKNCNKFCEKPNQTCCASNAG